MSDDTGPLAALAVLGKIASVPSLIGAGYAAMKGEHPRWAQFFFTATAVVASALTGLVVHDAWKIDIPTGKVVLVGSYAIIWALWIGAIETVFRNEAVRCFWEGWHSYLMPGERTFPVDPKFIHAFCNTSRAERARLRAGQPVNLI